MELKICRPDKLDNHGFTLPELITTVAVIGIIASIALPAFSKWLPGHRLRKSVQELYSNLYLAKMLAIKENQNYRIVFKNEAKDIYCIEDSDGNVYKTVSLNGPDIPGSICYGHGNAKISATVSGSSFPGDGISYSYNKASFNSRGLGKSGYIYLTNSNGAAYAVGTWASGIVVLKKWDEETESWK